MGGALSPVRGKEMLEWLKYSQKASLQRESLFADERLCEGIRWLVLVSRSLIQCDDSAFSFSAVRVGYRAKCAGKKLQ